MSNLILPGSAEYRKFRRSSEGIDILGAYSNISRVYDAIAPIVDAAKEAAPCAALALALSACGGDNASVPATQPEQAPQAQEAQAVPAEPAAKADEAKPESKPEPVVAPKVPSEADVLPARPQDALPRPRAKADEEAAKSRLADILDEMPADKVGSIMETPAGKKIEEVVAKRGIAVVPKIVTLIDRGVWDPNYPFYGLDDVQDYDASLGIRGDIGEMQRSASERLSATVRPFSKGMLKVSALDDVLLNIFVENINLKTKRSAFEDLGARSTRATVGVGARINDILDMKNFVLIAGLDFTYDDAEFDERGTTPKKKHVGMPGINILLSLPDYDMTAYFRARAGNGRWASFPGKTSGLTGYNDYRKSEIYAELMKSFKEGWNAGAEFSWQREDFAAVKEDLSRWALTLKAGKNNILKPFGIKNGIISGIDAMIAYRHVQRHHETKGTTDYDRISLIGSIPVYGRDGQENVLIRPEFGYEFNGVGAYAALELLIKLGK
jgi:hypothetical protein